MQIRYRFGRRWGNVFGVRFVAAYSPVGKSRPWERWSTDCPLIGWGDTDCSYTTTPLSDSMQRWMFGFSVFVGG